MRTSADTEWATWNGTTLRPEWDKLVGCEKRPVRSHVIKIYDVFTNPGSGNKHMGKVKVTGAKEQLVTKYPVDLFPMYHP